VSTELDTAHEPGLLAGRHAVVTGGGRGIGAAIASALAAHGASLTLLGRDLDALTAHAAQVRAAHRVDVFVVKCDVSVADDIASAFADARGALGDPHILVNNAGQAEGRPFLETSAELWQRLLDVNLTGAFHCTRQVLDAMLRAGDGRIINVASTSGLTGYRNTAAYSASKHGLIGLTRALAAEVARRGVTVNAVCPAYTDTGMATRAVAGIVRDMGRTESEARAMLTRKNPLGRLIEPSEVASAVVWLCSPGAAAMTGQAIVVAGGELM
jgi:NAD(P)-dependent dehydrogenase (short-subunit alcohol dehydrogenase family)